jgi:dephospho-CoA kinase
MLLVGLTGGLATGKSFVGRSLRDLGCQLIQADELGHQVLARRGEAYQPVVEEFGADLVNADGEIDRRLLASRVFSHPDRLARLNALVHPHVHAREQALVAEFSRRDPSAIVVVEAAILIETGSYKRFDVLVLAVCPEADQIERAMHRDGITRQEAADRLARQMPLAEKRRFADFLIDTSGTKERTHAQVRAVYRALRERNQQ